jgi:hypothetical protein
LECETLTLARYNRMAATPNAGSLLSQNETCHQSMLHLESPRQLFCHLLGKSEYERHHCIKILESTVKWFIFEWSKTTGGGNKYNSVVLYFTSLIPLFVQNPPSVPTLVAVKWASWFRNSSFVIDWHNFGYTLLGLSLGRNSRFVSLYKWY